MENNKNKKVEDQTPALGQSNEIKPENPGIVGFVALALFVIVFSGVFRGKGPWQALDFSSMAGKYGAVGEGLTWLGKGGVGAREGFLSAFGNIPTVMFALGLVYLTQHYKGLEAARVIFTPLLKPLIGIPGEAGLTFVTSLNSSDAAAVMTRDLFDKGLLTNNQRTIFASFQFAGSGTIINTFVCAAMVPMLSVSPLLCLGVILVMKFIGANLVRLILHRGFDLKKSVKA